VSYIRRVKKALSSSEPLGCGGGKGKKKRRHFEGGPRISSEDFPKRANSKQIKEDFKRERNRGPLVCKTPECQRNKKEGRDLPANPEGSEQ